MPRRALLFATAAIALVAFPRGAGASETATAQALFDQGRRLMAQGRYAEACPKLEESQKLDPAGGTVLHLAICREHEGRLATAWASYQDALAAAKRDNRPERAKIAEARIAILTPRLPKMRVRVAAADRAMKGFTLTRDDAPVGQAQWGEAIPVDPGTRTIRAEAEGHKPWIAQVDVPPEPREIVVEVPELAPDPTAAGTATPPVSREEPPKPYSGTEGDTQRTVGLVATGVGAIGLGVGTVFGLLSMGQKSDANAHCAPPDYKLCDSTGVEAGDKAIRFGNVSTIAFVAGGVLVAGGLVLYFTARGDDGRRTRVGVGPGTASVAWSFR